MQLATDSEPRVIFEDDDILVVDKPGGMVCHSASRPEHPTLVAWVRRYLEEAGKTRLPPKSETWERHSCRDSERSPANRSGQECPSHVQPVARLINRLDRETSGLVIIARNERAARILGKQVLRREVEKEYIAICWGRFEQERGVVDQPIGLTRESVVYTKRVVDEVLGKPCVTEFEIEKRLEGFTVVRLRPRTGRAHQLRVHMAWLGHPIVGDKVYGPDETLYLQFIKEGVTDEMLGRLLLARHALHAERVTFRHPTSQEPVTFRAPLPDDMQQFLAAKGSDAPAPCRSTGER